MASRGSEERAIECEGGGRLEGASKRERWKVCRGEGWGGGLGQGARRMGGESRRACLNRGAPWAASGM